MSEIAASKLQELRDRARSKFSTTEIENFINLGKRVASKAVLSLLASMLEAAGFPELAAETTGLIPYKDTGYMKCEFKEMSEALCITLCLVDNGYRTEIDIPHEDYAKDVFDKYNALKSIAIAFWKQFSEENALYMSRVKESLSTVDLTTLITDPANPTVLYFDNTSAKRVGIYCFYVDNKSGVARYKKR